MRPLILLLLLLLAFSCRTRKDSASDFSDTSQARLVTQINRDSLANSLLNLRHASDIEITGITVEFFPPDSQHPDIRAKPKSLHVDLLKHKQASDITQVKSEATADNETVNFRAGHDTHNKQLTKTRADALSPPLLILLIAALFIAVLIFARRRISR